MKQAAKQAVSSHGRKSVGNRIITVILCLCICILMSGLIVQAQLMNIQVKFYSTALAYCYETDCSKLGDTNTDSDTDLKTPEL